MLRARALRGRAIKCNGTKCNVIFFSSRLSVLAGRRQEAARAWRTQSEVSRCRSQARRLLTPSLEGGGSAKKAKVTAEPEPAMQRFSETGKVGEMLPLFYGKLFPTAEMVRCASRTGTPHVRPVDLSQLALVRERLGRLKRGRLLLPGTPGTSRQNASCQRLTRRAQRREFCFTLENDVFVRYQSFKDSAELRAALVKRRAARRAPPPPAALTRPSPGAPRRLILGRCSTWTPRSAPPTPPWARTVSLRPPSASSCSTWCVESHCCSAARALTERAPGSDGLR